MPWDGIDSVVGNSRHSDRKTGEFAPSYATVKNWVAQFQRGDFSTFFFLVGLRTYQHPGTMFLHHQSHMFNWIAHASLLLSFELSAVSGHGVQPAAIVTGLFRTWDINRINGENMAIQCNIN
jgi:hypothetical protein